MRHHPFSLAAVIIAATTAAATVGSADAIAAAAEQDQQDDDPPAAIPTKTVIAHKTTSMQDFQRPLGRSFHVMTSPQFCALLFRRGYSKILEKSKRGIPYEKTCEYFSAYVPAALWVWE
jgi:hypothetical protein